YVGDYQRQLFLIDHAGLPLRTVLEQIDMLGEIAPVLRREFEAMRPAHVPEAPTHASLVAAASRGGWPLTADLRQGPAGPLAIADRCLARAARADVELRVDQHDVTDDRVDPTWPLVDRRVHQGEVLNRQIRRVGELGARGDADVGAVDAAPLGGDGDVVAILQQDRVAAGA